MQSWQPGKRARSTFAVVLVASWVGACDADDAGLFSGGAPLSPTGGGGSSMAPAAGASGSGGARPPALSAGAGGSSQAPNGDPDGGAPVDGLPPEPLPDTPDVTFEDDDCPSFAPCGGALTGSWVYTGACIDLEQQLRAGGCAADAVNVEATVSGSLRFNGDTVQHRGTGSGNGELRITNICTLAIGGCPGLRALIDGDDDACVQTGTDCLCAFATEELEWDEDTYRAAGSTFTLGSGRTFDYCVTGATLTYRETSEGVSPQDAALHVLTRQ